MPELVSGILLCLLFLSSRFPSLRAKRSNPAPPPSGAAAEQAPAVTRDRAQPSRRGEAGLLRFARNDGGALVRSPTSRDTNLRSPRQIPTARGPRQRDQLINHRIILITAARQRPCPRRVETTVANQLHRRDGTRRPRRAPDNCRDRAPVCLFSRSTCVTLHSRLACASATRGAATSRHGAIVRPACSNSLTPLRQRRRGLAHLFHQVVRGQIENKLAALLGEGRRILEPFAGETDDRRLHRGEGVEEAVGREVDRGRPSARVEIQPIGRGAMIALNGSCGRIVLSRARVS